LECGLRLALASAYRSFRRSLKLVTAAIILTGIALGAKAMGVFDDKTTRLEKLVAQMSISSVQGLRKECLKSANEDCLLIVYKRLVELDPSDVSFRANYAMLLTNLKRYGEALPIFEKLVSEGQGSYDLLAYYGSCLDAIGETKKAIDWYEKSLSVFPNLVDVTQKLAIAMTKEKRYYEAISLLESFIFKFPHSEGSLKGNLVSIQSQIENTTSAHPTEKLRLITIRGSHYFVPIRMAPNSAPVSFLVDTGATSFVMRTADIAKAFPESHRKAKQGFALLADGRRVVAYFTVIPELQVGSWKVKNVATSFCDACENLAGMSVLSRFSMKTVPNGHLETMELTLAK
jgi:predicted aspartyl protease